MSFVIVLAAGRGERFGGTRHKALSPLLWGEGSLQRLLRQLRSLGAVQDLRVVTDHHRHEVCGAVRALVPDALTPGLAPDHRPSILRSLLTGYAVAPLRKPRPGAWVLFADTVYCRSTLEALLAEPLDTMTIASVASKGVTDHPIGLQSWPDDPSGLRMIGPEIEPLDGVMAPAVFWPMATLERLPALIDMGLTSQWQAARALIGSQRIRVVPCAQGSIQDIDTKDDLRRMRRDIVGTQAIAHFRKEISKDERTLGQPDDVVAGRFVKQCVSARLADLEHAVLRWLSHDADDCLVPWAERSDNRRLVMTYTQGIRLFDLLRLLGDLAQHNTTLRERAQQTATQLMRCAVHRLMKIQQSLARWACDKALPPYPFEAKVSSLVECLSHALDLPGLTHEERQELIALGQVWSERDARVPFRDATPKNMIIQLPSIDLQVGQAPHVRLALLADWLDQCAKGPEMLSREVRIIDYDFTSVEHLTAPEDDFISLLGHEGSVDAGLRFLREACPKASDWAGAVSTWARPPGDAAFPDRARFARALMVRYLRFGGRKLLYRMINPAGYAVRFRHDHPEFYLVRLPELLEQIDPAFKSCWPATYRRLELLAQAVQGLPGWSSVEVQSDIYLELVGSRVSYWQESPLERATSGALAGAPT